MGLHTHTGLAIENDLQTQSSQLHVSRDSSSSSASSLPSSTLIPSYEASSTPTPALTPPRPSPPLSQPDSTPSRYATMGFSVTDAAQERERERERKREREMPLVTGGAEERAESSGSHKNLAGLLASVASVTASCKTRRDMSLTLHTLHRDPPRSLLEVEKNAPMQVVAQHVLRERENAITAIRQQLQQREALRKQTWLSKSAPTASGEHSPRASLSSSSASLSRRAISSCSNTPHSLASVTTVSRVKLRQVSPAASATSTGSDFSTTSAPGGSQAYHTSLMGGGKGCWRQGCHGDCVSCRILAAAANGCQGLEGEEEEEPSPA